MASIQRSVSSGSEGGDPTMDDRKRKRMLSNRESARRSRMRKQKQLEDLTEEANRLQDANQRLVESIKMKENAYAEMEGANNILKAQTMELADRLRSLNSILEIAETVTGLAVEIPQIPDPVLNPWQLPYPLHPIMPYPDMFMH